MKKLLILLMAAMFLVACGSSDDEEVVVDETVIDESEEEKAKEEEEQKAKEEAEAQKAKEEKEKQEKEEAAKKAEKEEKEKKEAEEKAKKEEEENEPEETTELDTTWDDIKEKDQIVGKSDKDLSEITKVKPSDVRNDNTGNWRITKISENIDIEEYALSYLDSHMEDDEIHFIVNFNYNTTSSLSYMNELLYLDIYEYVDKEEHDASTLGSGMLLKSYVIYPDGDIQELDI